MPKNREGLLIMDKDNISTGLKEVGIDIGHGGSDNGATYTTTYGITLVEKDMNLTAGLACIERIDNSGLMKAVPSRTTDVYMSLRDRANFFNDKKVESAVSIHHNAGKGDGFEAIHTILTDKSEGDEIAKHIADYVSIHFYQNVRRVYSVEGLNGDYHGIIRMTTMPMVITEGCFIDNEVDFQLFSTPYQQRKYGRIVADAILTYYYPNYQPQDVDELATANERITELELKLSGYAPKIEKLNLLEDLTRTFAESITALLSEGN